MTERDSAIRRVIAKRVKNIREHILPNVPNDERKYYEGKADGLMQAYELIGDEIESIKVEL